jgi:hypothetical protein
MYVGLSKHIEWQRVVRGSLFANLFFTRYMDLLDAKLALPIAKRFSSRTTQHRKRLESCTLWNTQTFQNWSSCHTTHVTVALMRSKAAVAQQCVPTMASGHAYTNVATRMMEARGVHSWWPRQGSRGPWGKAPRTTIAGGQSPMKQDPGERLERKSPRG